MKEHLLKVDGLESVNIIFNGWNSSKLLPLLLLRSHIVHHILADRNMIAKQELTVWNQQLLKDDFVVNF